MQQKPTLIRQVNRLIIRRTSVFYAIACLISWPFFWMRDRNPALWGSLTSLSALKYFFIMWGPALGALVCFIVFRKQHTRVITFQSGKEFAAGALFFSIPFVLSAIFDVNWHYLKSAPLMFTYILGEELGWRGYLQDVLRPIAPVKRFVLIGVLWEFWHFTTRTTYGEPLQILIRLCISYPAVIILSLIIGFATERTKSLWIAVGIHALVDFCFQGPPSPPKNLLAVLSVTLFFWGLILWLWPNRKILTVLDPVENSQINH